MLEIAITDLSIILEQSFIVFRHCLTWKTRLCQQTMPSMESEEINVKNNVDLQSVKFEVMFVSLQYKVQPQIDFWSYSLLCSIKGYAPLLIYFL